MTIVQNELRRFSLLLVNVLCIIVSNIRDLYLIRCKDGKVKMGTAVDEGNFRRSCRVAKDKMLNLISFVIFAVSGRQ